MTTPAMKTPIPSGIVKMVSHDRAPRPVDSSREFESFDKYTARMKGKKARNGAAIIIMHPIGRFPFVVGSLAGSRGGGGGGGVELSMSVRVSDLFDVLVRDLQRDPDEQELEGEPDPRDQPVTE